MTKYILTFAFLILISASQAFSQSVEAQVGKIREIYAATNKRIADGLKEDTEGFHYAVWRVGGSGDTMRWSAVGVMETVDEIWFDGGDAGGAETEEDARAVIYKIVSTYKGASVLHSRSEYYLDEAGKLGFILASDDSNSEIGKLVERRFYYANDKLIRVTSGGKNTDKNFPADDLEKSEEQSGIARESRKRYVEML